ncbi:hypothetical protein DABAL43B_0876 [Psychrobacter sp. DAB_AL43B]|nr:hypothetical protein DABAL43B_0876 [Psychrobacter sp. DAB_AL43B]
MVRGIANVIFWCENLKIRRSLFFLPTLYRQCSTRPNLSVNNNQYEEVYLLIKNIPSTILISILLTGCLTKTNVCSSSIQPTIELQDFQKLTKNGKALFYTFDKN